MARKKPKKSRGYGRRRNAAHADLDLMAVRLRQGHTVVMIASELGMAESTAYKWANSERVKELVRELRRVQLAKASDTLAEAADEAAQTILSLMRDTNEQGYVRKDCARLVLELGGKMRTEVDIEERVRTLERNAATPSTPAPQQLETAADEGAAT